MRDARCTLHHCIFSCMFCGALAYFSSRRVLKHSSQCSCQSLAHAICVTCLTLSLFLSRTHRTLCTLALFFFVIIALLSEREYNSCRRIPEPNGAAAIDRRLVERMANCTQRISASPKHTNMPRARARTAITRACA